MISYKNNPFGDIVLNGQKALAIKQEAYLAGTHENPVYQAMAEDVVGNQYRVVWYPYDNFMDFEDESDCCDWDVYNVFPA